MAIDCRNWFVNYNLVSMFLPRIHLSNYKVIDITEDVAKTILQKMDKATNWISDYIGDYDIDDVVDQIELKWIM